MARYEEVETRIWDEPDMEGWPPYAKLLYVYLLTSPLSHGTTGAYPITERQIRNHTNLKPRQIARAFAIMGKRVRRYEGAWIWIVARFRHACKSPNHFRAAMRYLGEEVPAALVGDFAGVYTNSDVDTKYGPEISTLQGATKVLGRCSPPTPSPNPTPNPNPNPAPGPSHSEVFHATLSEARGGTGTRFMKVSNGGTYEARLSDNGTGLALRRLDRKGPEELVFSPSQMAEFEKE